MQIVFIRHSLSEVNPAIPIPRWGLSERGIQLAKLWSRHEIVTRLEVIYTSFQTKALETALYLAKPNSIAIVPDAKLTEVTSFTLVFEADPQRYHQSVADFYSGKRKRLYGGETKGEALRRFGTAVERVVVGERARQSVGIVSHGNMLALYASLWKKVDPYALHTVIGQPDIAIFDWEKKAFVSFFGECALSPVPG